MRLEREPLYPGGGGPGGGLGAGGRSWPPKGALKPEKGMRGGRGPAKLPVQSHHAFQTSLYTFGEDTYSPLLGQYEIGAENVMMYSA